MRLRHVPCLDARYWVAISCASVFGANLGDFVSHILELGHIAGLPWLALAFVAIIVVERRARFETEAFYWLAIVTLRTAATNLSDLATHDLRLDYRWAIAGLAALLAVLLVLKRDDPAAEGLPATGALYWLAMLTAGTLGTAAGDYAADMLGLGVSSTVFVAVLLLLLAIGGRITLRMRVFYWVTIVAVRTAGTNVGDFLAGGEGLDFGLPVSTAFTGLVLVGTLLLWRPQPRALPQA